MKTLIYFNRPDCPENMGISQLTDNLQQFLLDRSDILVNPIINGNILTFDKTIIVDEVKTIETGFAILTETPDNFEN
jgi:hypothetical protein